MKLLNWDFMERGLCFLICFQCFGYVWDLKKKLLSFECNCTVQRPSEHPVTEDQKKKGVQ